MRPIKEGDIVKCPKGHVPCGNLDDTDESIYFSKYKQSIICVPRDRQSTDCPITDIRFKTRPDLDESETSITLDNDNDVSEQQEENPNRIDDDVPLGPWQQF